MIAAIRHFLASRFIALLGLDASTGVFMLLYLDLAIAERKAEGRLTTDEDLTEAIVDGAARRLRPNWTGSVGRISRLY